MIRFVAGVSPSLNRYTQAAGWEDIYATAVASSNGRDPPPSTALGMTTAAGSIYVFGGQLGSFSAPGLTRICGLAARIHLRECFDLLFNWEVVLSEKV